MVRYATFDYNLRYSSVKLIQKALDSWAARGLGKPAVIYSSPYWKEVLGDSWSGIPIRYVGGVLACEFHLDSEMPRNR